MFHLQQWLRLGQRSSRQRSLLQMLSECLYFPHSRHTQSKQLQPRHQLMN